MDESAVPPAPKPFPYKRLWWAVLLLIAVWVIWAVVVVFEKNPKIRTIRAALLPAVFEPLPLGDIQPTGWLLQQLKLQASGLSGHLDEFWPDVSQSGWIGGKGEGWERGPYWLDGVIPLAYETNDPVLKKKVSRWVDTILKNQQADGWLGPNQGASNFGLDSPPNVPRDPWPQFVVLKALSQYQEATGDPRIIPAMERDLANINQQLDQRPLFDWNYMRWGDLLVTLDWLYDQTKEPWILNFEAKVAGQGYDWGRHFAAFPVKEKTFQWNMLSHGVNNAMGLKVPALLYRLTGQGIFKKLALSAPKTLDLYHGESNGLFSADECLAGKSPSQGTELCAVVETLFSLETSLSILGDVDFADRIEKIAFNALPATFSADYWEHQYVQQANQVACVFDPQPVYSTNRGMANLFGLEPQYGCCTANMHQGWPKFVSHLWMKTADGGLAAALYAPSVVQTNLGGQSVRVELATDYPFSETLTFNVDCAAPCDFPLYLRVPQWAKQATVQMPDGTLRPLSTGRYNKIQRHWSGKETLVLRLPMDFKIRSGFQGAASVEHGPLVFSLGLRESWKAVLPFRFQPKGARKSEYAVVPLDNWNYALSLNDPLQFQSGPLKGNPFTLEGAPVSVTVKARPLESWGFEHGAADPPPESPVESLDALQNLVLVPYGSTRLRVTEFPVLKKTN
jgi:hypothetical protein